MLLFVSLLAAWAAQPDPDTAPPAPGEWAWLNIPDATGPGARFSYETAIRRDGPRLEIRLRYDEANPARPARPPVPVEATIALDCAARTQQILARGRPGASRRLSRPAPPAPIAAGSREWTLAYLLCTRSAQR